MRSENFVFVVAGPSVDVVRLSQEVKVQRHVVAEGENVDVNLSFSLSSFSL